MWAIKGLVLILLQISVVKCAGIYSEDSTTLATSPLTVDQTTTATSAIIKESDDDDDTIFALSADNRTSKIYLENPKNPDSQEKNSPAVKNGPEHVKNEKADESKKHQHKNLIPHRNSIDNSKGVADDNEELTDDLENWQAPRFIQENFSYYIAGYDDDRRPIFIVEMGRMDLRRLITEQGKEVEAAFFKYLNQTALRLLQSMKNQSREDFPVTNLIAIVDFEGFHVRQLTSLPNLQMLLKIVSTFSKFLARHLHSVYIINATYLAEQFINLTRPVFGGTFSRFEVYGTSKKSWMPVIRRIAGENQLPSWYGGSSAFKPVAVFGR